MPDPSPADARSSAPELDAEPTEQLLVRVRAGERQALDQLFERYLPPLRRWASGRLPRRARDISDTQDLIQETLLSALRRLQGFELRHPGALHGYLRQAVLNRIRDEFRRARRRPDSGPLRDDQSHPDASPLEEAIGSQMVERYEAALARLKPEEQEAIVARVEFGYSYDEIAEALGKPSRDAARMAVTRAILKLAEEMEISRG